MCENVACTVPGAKSIKSAGTLAPELVKTWPHVQTADRIAWKGAIVPKDMLWMIGVSAFRLDSALVGMKV